MTKRKIAGIVAGGVFFGIAMGFREVFENMWIRAGFAGLGAAGGMGIAIAISCLRKRSE